MKDSREAGDARMGREFGSQLLLEQTLESGKGPSQDGSALRDGGGDHLRLGLSERGRDILGTGRDRLDASLLEFPRDLEEHPLSLHLPFDECRDEPEILDALDLDAGAAP